MSVNKLISIKNPIADAIDDLGLDHNKFIPVFTRWAEVAEKEIGSWAQYERARGVIPITNCTACLPPDAVYVQVALLGDHGTDCADLMNRWCMTLNATTNFGTVNNTFFVVDVSSTDEDGNWSSGNIPFSLQDNKMIFGRSYDGQSITIQYLRFKKDCDGFMEVGENHINAINWFIKWKYYMRSTKMNSLEYGKMNVCKSEWERECAHARAQDAELTPSERSEIVGALNSPYTGIGLSAGMNTTLGGYYSIW
jgi:hypothetical protein